MIIYTCDKCKKEFEGFDIVFHGSAVLCHPCYMQVVVDNIEIDNMPHIDPPACECKTDTDRHSRWCPMDKAG